jgi:hypothetical protein
VLAGKHCSPWVLVLGLGVIVVALILSLGSVRSHSKTVQPEPPMHVQR